MAKSKHAKRFIWTVNSILMLGAGFGITYGTFHFFPEVADQVIENLNITVQEEDDESLIQTLQDRGLDVERLKNQKQQAQSDFQNAAEERQAEEDKRNKAEDAISIEMKAAVREIKDLKSKLDNKVVTSRNNAQKNLEKHAEGIVQIIETIENQLKKIQEISNELKQLQASETEDYKLLESTQANFKKGLNNTSNTAEFFLYLLGLKVLWGIFTGYARTVYPYEEKYAFEDAYQNLNKNLPLHKEALERKRAELERERENLTSSIKRADDRLKNIGSEAHANFVGKTVIPVLNALMRYNAADQENQRVNERVLEEVKAFRVSYRYLPAAAIGYKPADRYQTVELAKRQSDNQTVEQVREDLSERQTELESVLEKVLAYLPTFKNTWLSKKPTIVIKKSKTSKTTKKTTA